MNNLMGFLVGLWIKDIQYDIQSELRIDIYRQFDRQEFYKLEKYNSLLIMFIFHFRVKQYFYGPNGNLFPHSFDVKFDELKVRI